MRARAIVILALAMSACQFVDDNHLTARDWADRGLKREAQPGAFWCYRTLGRPECSTTPIPGQEHRLIEGGPQPPEAAPLPAPPPEPTQVAGTRPATTEQPRAPESFGAQLSRFFGL